jgi:quinol monooxygenase YgiN
MFARFLELTTTPDKKPALSKAIKDQIIPIFRQHKGFFDVIHLEAETDPAKMYAVTLWRDKADLEKYAKQDFPKVKAILEPFLAAPIMVKHCTVNEAISMKFISAVAA